MDIDIEKRTVEFNDVYVKRGNNIAKIDNVLNTLTVLIYSEKDKVPISDPSVVNYLSSYNLIQPVGSGYYTTNNKPGCMEMSDALSDYMDELLNSF